MTVNSENISLAVEPVKTPSNNENTSTNAPVTEQETQEQINWKKFRQQREEEAKRAREAEEKAAKTAAEAEALKAALEAVLNKPQQNNYETNQDPDEDALFKQRMEKLLQERDEKLRKEREEQEKRSLPQKLQQTYGDFQAVCTQENIDYLEYHYPEVAAGLQYMPDGFDKWSNVYKAVKRFVPNPQSQKAMQKADQNLNKPQSVNTGLSSTSDTTPHLMLDESKKKANWQRMKKLSKGL